MLNSKRWAVAAVLIGMGLIAISVAAWMFIGRQSRVLPEHARRQGLSSDRAPVELANGTALAATAVEARVAAVLREQLAGRGLSDADIKAIAATAARTTDVLWSGSREDFGSLLEAQGLSVDQPGTQLGDDRWWAERTRVVRDAPVDLSGMKVVMRMQRGKPLPTVAPPPGMGTTTLTRTTPRGSADVTDPAAAGTDLVEVQIPAKLTPWEGDPFVGRFGLLLAKRPSDGTWVVIGYNADAVPPGRALVLPPL